MKGKQALKFKTIVAAGKQRFEETKLKPGSQWLVFCNLDLFNFLLWLMMMMMDEEESEFEGKQEYHCVRSV